MRTTAVVLLMAAFASPMAAQSTTEVHPGLAGSPHVRTTWRMEGAQIAIQYGRPSLRGRTIGREVARYGREWRTGADQATTLVTDAPLKFGENLLVPAGTYTLYTVPGEDEWELIISRRTGQWGVPYPHGHDLGRAPMGVTTLADPVEQLTIAIEEMDGGGLLRIEWGTVSARIVFEVV